MNDSYKMLYKEFPMYTLSYEAFLCEKYNDSICLLEKLIKDIPERFEFLNDLGICYFLDGNRNRSQETLKRAMKFLGNNSAPYINFRYIFNPDRFQSYEGDLSKHEYKIIEDQLDLSHRLVSIIILEYKNPELTLNCLRSIQKSRICVPYEIILIDNSEDDHSHYYESIRGIKNFTYQKNIKNLGFSKGCNQGAALAKGQFLYFVNNDTLFQKSCVEELVRILLLDKNVGIVGSKLLYKDNTIQHAGVVFDFLTGIPKHRCRFYNSDFSEVNIPLNLQAVTGASLMIPRNLFLKVNGFCEDYFNGYEDIDLCLKVFKAGYRIVYNPRSVLYHIESVGPGRHNHDKANLNYFQKRWLKEVKRDELEYLSLKENLLLSFTEDPDLGKRRAQIFKLITYLDRKYPEILSLIPLHYIERYKHNRFSKFCTNLFDFLIRINKKDEAKVIYRYFLMSHFYHVKYICHMKQTLR